MARKDEVELDETLYEQDADEMDKAYRASRGDFVVDIEDEKEDEEDIEDDSDDSEEDEEDEDGEESSKDEEEDDNEESDEEDSEEEEDDPTDKRIPRSRLNQVIEQRDELRDQIAWYQEQMETLLSKQEQSSKKDEPEEPDLPPYDFDLAETKYIELILEGDTTKALALRREINEERETLFNRKIDEVRSHADDVATNKSSSAIEENKFNALIESFENKYPFLSNTSDDYNEEAIDTVNTLFLGYQQEGLSKSAAMTKAVNKIAPMYSKTESSPKPGLGKKRIKAAKTKALDATKKQPNKPTNTVKDRKETLADIDLESMSEAQFKKLTAKEKAVLRGDVVG